MIGLGLDGGYGVLQIALLVAGGLLLWTLTEYWLHRLLFHWEPKFRYGDRLHFIIHGVHHDHPNDRMRLVMPPALSIPLGLAFLALFVLVFGTPAAYPLYAGLLVGYLTYDYTPTTSTITHRRPDSASGCASSTCDTTSRITATGSVSPLPCGTSSSHPSPPSGGLAPQHASH